MANTDFAYDSPLQSGSPWPTYRRTTRNSASSPLRADYQGDSPWFLQTGKGIFSTPIIDAHGVIYVGSADHNFYAINSDGSEKWRFRTGEMIDSAGALPADTSETVLVPSGDGYLYKLSTDDGQQIWKFDARVSPRMSYNNWFEANVVIGPDGTIYAGNTNFNYYAITPDGQLKWTYETGSNAWSAAAIGPDNTIYWGSCDTFCHAVTPEGKRKWKRRTLGFISASAAIGLDSTIYIGSFDSYFYALDPHTGKTRWKYKTNDHIYSSAALLEDGRETKSIIFGSTDGILYALNSQGKLQWQYDTGAPIRSSPVIGRAPAGETGQIVYFGNGDGKVYALNAQTGERRWSYDTTGAGDALPDRNDLNGSPALGESGVYIGGEHGQLWYVPYDYPLHYPDDSRGCTESTEELPGEMTSLYYVTPGGRAQPDMPEKLPAASLICLKLIVREKAKTQPARFFNSPFFYRPEALRVTFEPQISFQWEVSGDGKYLYIIPDDFLEPGQRYSLSVSGRYYQGGLNVGNLTIGGRSVGRFDQTLEFEVENPEDDQFPLYIAEDAVSAFEWTRLAVPIPTMLPSLNQIGFDYMNWIIAPVAISQSGSNNAGKIVLWAIGATRNQDDELVVDTETDFRLPLNGRFQDDAFILTNRNFKMAITGIPIPFNIFQIRGRLGQDLRVLPGASAYAETEVLSIPTFGILMVVAGLANKIWKKLLALATYVTHPYPADGLANKRPTGVTVESVVFQPANRENPGTIIATIGVEKGQIYKVTEHLGAIVLVDTPKTEVVQLDYHKNLRQTGDELGNLCRIELTLPKGKRLPEETTAFVILDVFPIYQTKLGD
ncbi:MAG: PQQ-binding-like beta-propeller repeat protein [Anaerolineae bacterium]